MSFLLYFFSYFLTYVGFLLGSSTQDEHNEIKEMTLKISEIIKFVYFVLLIAVFYSNLLMWMFLVLILGLYLFNKFSFKNVEFKKLLEIFLLGISVLMFMEHISDMIGLVLILIFALIIDKSFEKFHLKESIYSMVIYIIIYVSYLVAGNLLLIN